MFPTRILRRALVEADQDIDEKMLFGALEGATNLHQAIVAVIRSILDDEALAKALRAAAALSVELLRKRQESS